ncbi:MAG: AAA family ATPase, partial [Clostridia bacterium]|nr:AAA family ATPase [Clostridia bacterium]
MLSFLSIRNTAIIDDLTVEFAPGMNCISGETGAGKSIIIDSVCYLLGDKMSKDIIRRGSSSSEITGVFNTDPQDARISAVLSELGIDPEEDGTVVIYRAFSDQSRNVCRINDRIVTVSALKRLGEALVDVYGQHDSHSLLSAQNHINYLDAFAGPGFENALAAYRVKLSEHKKTLELIDELNVDPMKRAQLIDLLTFQVGEIEGASLRSGEDDELEAKQKLIDNAEKIRDSLAFALEMLDGSGGYDQQSGAMSELDNAAAKLSSIEKFSPEFGELASKLKEAYYILEDVRDTLSDDTDEYSFDEGEARRIEQRIDLIYDLKRKYGKTVNDIIAFGADARERLDKLLDSEETARKLLKKSEEEIAELRK